MTRIAEAIQSVPTLVTQNIASFVEWSDRDLWARPPGLNHIPEQE